ncbi:hypothetical protein DRH13_06370 [Candidatus Woesebacteria bacterium]|nr:MAG: hypothetical protein DRH13_06370 [Candidatus Woesebacteria bacterium]
MSALDKNAYQNLSGSIPIPPTSKIEPLFNQNSGFMINNTDEQISGKKNAITIGQLVLFRTRS